MLRDENISHLGQFSTSAYFPFSRSSKYQSNQHKEITDSANTIEMNKEHHSKDAGAGQQVQTTGAGYEMEINVLPAKDPQVATGSDESCHKGSKELEIQEKQEQSNASPLLEDGSVAQEESSFLRNKDNEGYQAEGLQAPEPHALEGEEVLKRTEEAEEKVEAPRQQTKSAAAVPREKVRRFTLDRLRQLGVDVFIKPRLGADEDSFVILEEPETNRGNTLNCGEPLHSDLFWQLLTFCH